MAYAERIAEEYLGSAYDSSIFEKTEPIHDGTPGTQTLIRTGGLKKNP